MLWIWILPRLKSAPFAQVPNKDFVVITASRDPNLEVIQKNADLLKSIGIPFFVASAAPLISKTPPFQFLFAPELNFLGNKKHLLLQLWKSAEAPYYLQLDDDVLLQIHTLSELTQFRWADLNILPLYTDNKAWWGSFDFIEHLSLVLIGLGINSSHLPTSCSGAYLLYSKSLAHQAEQQKDWFLEHASGDDMDLLHLAHRNSLDIQSIPSPKLWLSTSGKSSIRAFLHQRLRWINKPRARQFPGSWVFGTFTLAWYWIFLGVAFITSPLLGCFFFLLKTGIDFWVFSRNAPTQKKIKASSILFFEVCYPVYLASLLMMHISTKKRKW